MSSTPYDDAFRTLVNDCTPLLIPLLNVVFGKNYTGKEQIVPQPNEHFVNQQDGKSDKRISDSAFAVVGKTTDRYLFECQSTVDNLIIIRLFEYGTQIALDNSTVNKYVLEATFPHAVVLFLRSNSNTPDKFEVVLHTPGGTVSFDCPVLKMKNYNIEYIFTKRLYFLLPFYIFTKEASFDEYSKDSSKLGELKREYATIQNKLEEAAKEGKLSYYHMRTIIEMSKVVLEKIAEKYETVRKEVESVMGGRILEHESKDIYNAGIQFGREQGIEQGIEQATIIYINNLRMTTGLSVQQIMDGMRLPQADQERYKKMIS